MNNQEICKLIETAFAQDKAVHLPEQIGNSSSIEAERIRNFFTGKSWKEITLEALQDDYIGDGSACLSFMTPEAAAYYIPAYLRIAILYYIKADSISSEFVFKLLRVARGEESRIADAIALLNKEQNLAIAKVLEWIALQGESMAGNQDAPEALRLKWHAYLR